MAHPGANLRAVRKALNKTTYEMAKLLDMPQGTYSKWETGKMEIKVSGLSKLYLKTGALPNFICSSIPPMFEKIKVNTSIEEVRAEQLSISAKLDYITSRT